MHLDIRSFHLSDLIALYHICLKTGDSGKDSSHIYKNPDLLGHYFAAPYAVLEPDLCFILTCSAVPCGYVLGTRDSNIFSSRTETEWFPVLRQQYPLPLPEHDSPDAKIIRLIHAGYNLKKDLTDYPAHLHINLLPYAQGKGFGRRLIKSFVDRLREQNVSAVHLGVGRANENAINFYEHVGFHRLFEYEASFVCGMRIT